MKVLDLYCGAGGFSEGFRLAGHDILVGIDHWSTALNTISLNHGSSLKTIQKDIYEISFLSDQEFFEIIPLETEIIIGSPPCVSFSNSNRSGFTDKSLGIKLIESFFRIVARVKYSDNSKLKYWIMENVPKSEKFINEYYTPTDLDLEQFGIKNTLEVKVGEGLSSGLYKANYYGVPSRRQRYFCGKFIKPTINILPPKTLGEIVESLDKTGTIQDPVWENLSLDKDSISDLNYLREIPLWLLNIAKRKKQDKGYMGKMPIPENMNQIARTVLSSSSMGARETMILPIKNKKGKYRHPTVREFATIMSFPINYDFTGVSHQNKIKQVGNSVPPKLAYEFGIVMEGKSKNIKKFNSERLSLNGFINLNGMSLPPHEEKERPFKTFFSDHIPYFKIDRYRVVIDNKLSNFEKRKIRWNVYMNYGSGKGYRILNPRANSNFFKQIKLTKNDLELIRSMKKNVGTALNLQKNYCKTSEDRKRNDLTGPIELLLAIKHHIKKRYKINDDNLEGFDNIECNIGTQTSNIPEPIIYGYVLLRKILY